LEARRVTELGVAQGPASGAQFLRVAFAALARAAGLAWADRYRRWALVVAVLAVGLRIAWVLYADVGPTDGRFDDTSWYHFSGHNIALGRGYINPFFGGPTAMWPPGYPAVLGALYFFVGPNVLAAKLLNVLLGALVSLVAYEIGARAFDRRTGLGAALILAAFPSQVLFTSLLMSELLFEAVFAVTVLVVLRGAGTDGSVSRRVLVALGLLAGAGTLVRGEMGLFPLVLLAYWGLSTRAWRKAVRYAVTVAAVSLVFIGPWFVRNLVKMDAPVVVSTTLGGNLWMGNHEGASGHFEVREEYDRIARQYLHLSPAEQEVKLDRRFLREALSYMATHPVEEIRLAKDKLAATYSGDDAALFWNEGFRGRPVVGDGLRSALKAVANDYYYAVLAGSVLGALAWARRWRGPGLLLLLATLYWTAIHVVFFGDQRFHFAVLPFLSVLAAVPFAAAIAWVAGRLPRGAVRRVGVTEVARA